MIRTVTTDSSVWRIDEDSMLWMRLPRGENPGFHPTGLTYDLTGSCQWQEFVRVETFDDVDFGGRRIQVEVEGGRHFTSGIIVDDTHAPERCVGEISASWLGARTWRYEDAS